MSERRVSFEIPVVHDTAVAVLRGLPDAVRAVIEASPRARFVRCSLLTLTETALRYEVVYFVRAPELAVYAEVQHGIMIALMEKFRELGVQFPTPAQVPMPTKAPLPMPRSEKFATPPPRHWQGRRIDTGSPACFACIIDMTSLSSMLYS